MRHGSLLTLATMLLLPACLPGQEIITGGVPREPVTRHPHDLDASYIRMPLAAADAKYGTLDGDHMKEFVEEIVAVSLKSKADGELLWGRQAGTIYDDMVEGIVERHFREMGLQDVHRQYFDLDPQWFPTSWDFTARAGGRTLHFETARAATNAVASSPQGMDLEPVWVGLGTASDFEGRDVRGKLVLIQSMPMPGVVSHSAAYNGSAERAGELGAAAVAINVAIPGNMQVQIRFNTGVPTFTIGTQDMEALRQAMEEGPVSVHVQLSVEHREGLRDANVWGVLPGTTDEDIIVMAHHDAHFTGALDNASGMAVMLGLAEYFSKIPQSQRRRTIKFVTTSGHHVGSAGTRWMHDNRDTFLANTVLAINAEHVSVVQTYYDRRAPVLRNSDNIDARRWWVNGSSALARIALDSWRTFGVTIYDDMENNASGDMSPMDRDVPSIQLIESAAYYHTDADLPEHVPAPGLAAVARAYAKIIDRVNELEKSDLLPVPIAP
jgi:hypothetical protein